MKVLQITSTFFPVLGGQEKVVYEISKRLAKKGHEVTILTTDLYCEEKNLPKQEIFEGIKIVRLKNDFILGGYGYSKELKSWLKKNWKNYEIVHSHGYNRYFSEFGIKFLYEKLPIIFSPHGFIHTKKNYFFKLVHDLTVGRMIRKANICTALTKLDFNEYKKLGVRKERIIEIPNGVDIEKFFKENKKEINVIKNEYGNFILYVGRVHESKGLQYVVESIKDIDTKLIVIGKDAGYKNFLEEIIKKLNMEKKVIFLGGLTDEKLISFYHASEAFVLFSEWEGFGIVIVEAMAAGKPLVVSDRGALPFLVKDKKNGFIIEFKNVKMLSEKIKTILNNKKLKRVMYLENKKESKKYDWKNIVDDYEKIYFKEIK